ncbi:MAG TPA: hypothetical protein VFO94_11480 [Gammaproteobacteria bacterium]|nr:hypothetical protein [Gammaproteobacteria bacterium]
MGVAVLSLALAACGGGHGGGGGSPPPADTTPQPFSFPAQTGVAVGTAVDSAVIVVGGIDAPATIAVSGGQYSINGQPFTSSSGTVSNGQQVRLRVATSASYEATVEATLTIGGVSAAFSVTTYAKDDTPEPFSFADVTGVPLDASVESSSITVAGINAPAAISVEGGEYSIDGQAFTGNAGTVANGQQVRLRVGASPGYETTVAATLTIGGVDAQFNVTTFALDDTPDAISFAAAEDVVRGAMVESATVTVAGINAAVPIAVAGGEYSIDGAPFTASGGTVVNGQTVQLRGTASATPGAAVTVTVTVSALSAAFEITTSSDVAPPVVTVLFPPAQSRTSGEQIVLRGTAHDADHSVKTLRVNGVDATTTDGYAHWTATLPLDVGDNALMVAAEDPYLNADAAAAEVGVRRHARFVTPSAVALDPAHGRALVVDSEARRLLAVDWATGARTVLSANGVPDHVNPFQAINSVVVDGTRALVYDAAKPALLAVDLDTGRRSVLSDRNTPDGLNLFESGRSMALDAANDRVLVLTSQPAAIYGVDLHTGSRTVISSASQPGATNPFVSPWAIALDAVNSRALVTDVGAAAIYAVDLATGARTILSDGRDPPNQLSFASSIVVDPIASNNRALVAEGDHNAIYAVDLTTGVRAPLSENGTPAANPFSYVWALAVDPALVPNEVVALDQRLRALLAVDLTTGERRFVSRDEPADALPALTEPKGLALDAANHRLLIGEHATPPSLVALDLTTAERSVFSDATNPDGSNALSKPRSIVLDDALGRALVLDDGPLPGLLPAAIYAVDLVSGARTILSDGTTPNNTLPLSHPLELALDRNHQRLLVTENNPPSVVTVDLTDGTRQLLSGSGVPDTANAFTNVIGAAVDEVNDRAIVANSTSSATSALVAVSLDTGLRTILSAEGIPDTENLFVDPSVLTVDQSHNRAFMMDILRGHLLDVSLTTGARAVISGSPEYDGDNPFDFPTGIAYDPSRDVVYVLNGNSAAVLAVDVPTGQRVYLLR